MRTTAILLLLAGLSAGLTACGGGDSDETTAAEVFVVQRGDLEVTLTETGTLRARNKVDITPRTKSSAKILSIVPEGTVVAAGDVLVELDKTDTEKEIEKLEDQVIQLETELKNAKNDEDIQRQENESETEQAKLNLEFAKLELERYVKGDHPQEKRDHELRIEKARTRLEQAEDKWKQMPRLLKAGFVTEVEAKEKELAYKEAQNELESANLALDLYEEYTHPMQLRQKESDVTEAERELKRVAARAEGRLDSKIAIVRQKQRQYETAVQKLDEAKKELENLTIRAPQPGIVIYSERRDRRGDVEETVKVGGTAYPGRTLIELPDLTRMDVEIQIHQADVGKVKKGQPVWVNIPGRKGGPLQASVGEIGSVAQSTSWRDPVKRFDVVVEISGEIQGLKAGVTAEVEVHVANLANVLYVPLQSVGSSAGVYYVYVREGDETIKRPVRLGASNDQYVEVKSGLSEGDRVLLVNPEVVTEDETEGAERSPNGPTAGGASGRSGRGGGNRSGGAR